MSKKCGTCKELKEDSEFHLRSKKNGMLATNCKVCANKISNNWYQNNKHKDLVRDRLNEYGKIKRSLIQKAVAAIKSKLSCSNCGEDDSCCLDFHHIDPNQKYLSISKIVEIKNIDRLIDEILKCVCVCSNCHRKIHAGRTECPASEFDRYFLESTISHLDFKKRYFYSDTRPKNLPKLYSHSCFQCTKVFSSKSKLAKFCTTECAKKSIRKVQRPNKEELETLIANNSFLAIGKMFGVSDNSVRKWAKVYNLI